MNPSQVPVRQSQMISRTSNNIEPSFIFEVSVESGDFVVEDHFRVNREAKTLTQDQEKILFSGNLSWLFKGRVERTTAEEENVSFCCCYINGLIFDQEIVKQVGLMKLSSTRFSHIKSMMKMTVGKKVPLNMNGGPNIFFVQEGDRLFKIHLTRIGSMGGWTILAFPYDQNALFFWQRDCRLFFPDQDYHI